MDWRSNPYGSLEVCSWEWKLAILSGESPDFWDIRIIHLSVNSDNSIFCFWVPTSILTWVQTLFENIKTLMNHRVQTKLIRHIKNFKQLVLKTTGNCENFGIIYMSGRYLGRIALNLWLQSTVIIPWTLYSPKVSQFEIISKLQLCYVIRAVPRITTKKYVPRTTSRQWPRLQRKVRYHKFLWLNMSFTHFWNLVNSPMLKNPTLFHQSFVLLGNVPDYKIKSGPMSRNSGQCPRLHHKVTRGAMSCNLGQCSRLQDEVW